MIIVDVEIKKAILGRGEMPIEGIEYCEGWRDFANMGIACVCTYDLTSHLSRVFLDDALTDLAAYLRDRVTAGFNTRRFDFKLLAEHGVGFDPEKHYDALEQIWVAQGLDPDNFYYKTHGGWSLDAVCSATFGHMKSGNGALAPVWWQRGERGKVIDYCLRDVWLEARLIAHILANSSVTNGRDSVSLEVPKNLISPSQ